MGYHCSSTTNRAVGTTKLQLKILGIYYQSCLGCSLQVCRVSFQHKSSTLRRSKRRGRQTAAVRNFSKRTCWCQKSWLTFRASGVDNRAGNCMIWLVLWFLTLLLKTFLKTKNAASGTPTTWLLQTVVLTPRCLFRLRKELHSVVQNAVDGERQRLETFRNKLVDARRRGFHFEQVRSRYVARRQSYERGEDGRTDRRLFVFI